MSVTSTAVPSRSVPASKRRDRVIFALRLAAVIIAGAVSIYLVYEYGKNHRMFDFKVYRHAVEFWLDGNNLYDYSQDDRVNGSLGFTYPPFGALALAPLGVLPYGVAQWTHMAILVAALAVCVYWLTAPLARRYGQPAWFVSGIALAAAYGLEPIRETISYAQINHVLVAMILFDFLFLIRRDSRWAGVGVGLAMAIKLTPGIFLIYLLITRRYRAAIGAMVSAAAVTLITAAIDFGTSTRFWFEVAWDSSRVGILDQTSNSSLGGLLLRAYDPNEYPGWVWLLAVAAVGGWGMWRSVVAFRSGDDIAGITLAGTVSVLVSPVSWIHHIFWIVPAILICVDAILRDWSKLSRVAAVAYAGLAALCFFPFLLTTSLRYGNSSGQHWDDGWLHWVGENNYVLIMVLLVFLLPIRGNVDATDMRPGRWWPMTSPRADEREPQRSDSAEVPVRQRQSESAGVG